MRVSAVCAHYTLHTYAVLYLLCNRFVFCFLCSWHFNFFRVLIDIAIVDSVQHLSVYDPGAICYFC